MCKMKLRRCTKSPSLELTSKEEATVPPKPKPAYKNADRATYFRDEITGEKYYKCPYCPKRLKGHLTIHLRTHTGRKPWNCSKCSKKFSQKCNLQTHMKAVHSTDKIFKCELCPKSFGYKKNLERHVSGHLLEKPYKCSFCPRRFSSVDYLCKHKRVHTGESPYSCVFCPEVKFAQYFEMMRHLRRDIRERSFMCQYCDEAFMTGENLRSHIRYTHFKITYQQQMDPVTCLFCEKIFLNKVRLFVHMRQMHLHELPQRRYKMKTPTPDRWECEENNCGRVYKTRRALRRHWNWCHRPVEEWPHYCVFCGRRFLEFSFLREHITKHTRERPEECEQCSETFRYKWEKRKHIRKVHPKKVRKDKVIIKKHVNCNCFDCKVCGKKCKSTRRLKKHFLRRHTGNEVVRLERINVNVIRGQKI